MKVLWICGLPNEVRLNGFKECLSPVPTAAWSWILGHLPPPNEVELHILCPVRGLIELEVHFDYQGAHWHCFRQKRFEQAFFWFRFIWTIRSLVPMGPSKALYDTYYKVHDLSEMYKVFESVLEARTDPLRIKRQDAVRKAKLVGSGAAEAICKHLSLKMLMG